MEHICVFCGTSLGRFGGQNLSCGDVLQPVCERCWDRYRNVPLVQRANLALETGRAQNPEGIRDYLRQRAEKLVTEAERRAFQEETLTCCGQRMVQLKEVSLLSRMDFFESYTGRMVMFRCGCCGQVKFFDASFLQCTPEEKEVPIPPETSAPAGPEAPRFKTGKKPPWEK